MISSAVETYAHYVGAIPLQWFADAGNLNELVSAELAYGVQVAVEDALINAAGPLPAPVGVLHDAGVQSITTVTGDAPGTILAALTAVSAQGYNQGAVCLHPNDWQGISSLKDANERYLYGAGPFQSPGRAIWGAPVVVSVAVPEGTVIVGDLGGAIRVVEREPVQVLSGTVQDELIKNLRTMVGESRLAFAVIRPQALAKASLAGTGVLSAEATSTRSTKTTK